MVKRSEHAQHSQCPMACALDIIGDHWSLLIVRGMLFLGVHEYKDFLAMPEGISSNILSDRLKKLEEEGLIASAPHPESGRRKLYYLTQCGKDLIYVMLAVARWADCHLEDRVCIPEDRRRLLTMPDEQVAGIVFGALAEWEAQNLGEN